MVTRMLRRRLGTLAALRPDTITLRTRAAAPVQLARESIVATEVRSGTRVSVLAVLGGMLVGAAVGTLAGGLAGVAVECGGSCDGGDDGYPQGLGGALIGGGLGLLVGTTTGGRLGARVRVTTWQRAQLPQ